MNRRKLKLALEAIDTIYRTLPVVDCKGLCTDTCGPIPMSKAEYLRMVAAGATPAVKDGRCTNLVDGRCSSYDERPGICRLFGGVDNPLMVCPHGCKVTNGPMNSDQGGLVLSMLTKIGGGVKMHPTAKAVFDLVAAAEIRPKVGGS
jgi:hypothetical protein